MPSRRSSAAVLLCFTTCAAAAATAARPAAAQTPRQPARRGTATVSGTVTESGSRAPVGNAGVAVIDQSGDVVGGVQTGADGRFRIPGVPAGTYELRVRAVGRTPYTNAVTLAEGEQRRVDVTLGQSSVNLQAVVVSASRKAEKITDAPADIQLATPATIQSTASTSLADAAKTLAGVDAFQQGGFAQTVVARGFNAVFSGVPYLVDYRPGASPGLNLPALHTMPETSDDVERMELVLGPASALYGPNYNAGVLQIITKSPFDDQGIQVLAQGGSRSFGKAQLRMAKAFTGAVAAKLSASYLTLNDFPVDPNDPYRLQEVANRQGYIANGGDTTSYTGRNIGNRDYTTHRVTVDGRVDLRPVEGLNVVTSGGYFQGQWLEMTGLGTSRNNDFGYGYGQSRATYGSLFAQVYRNFNRGRDLYRIPLGQHVYDYSTQNGAQLQFSPTYGRLSLVTGADYQDNKPRSRGTIYGRYEPDSRFKIAGAYAQGTYTFGPRFDLTASGRVDKHTFIERVMFSPRAALVFHPAADQAFRVTYNRAFATPSPLNYFLDLTQSRSNFVTGLAGADIRLQAPPRGTGFTFPVDAQGNPYWYNTLTNPASPKTQLPLTLSDANSWAVIQQLITALSQGQINGARLPAPGTQTPLGALPAVGLNLLNLSTSGGAPTPVTGPLQPIPATSAIADNVLELGYKGVVARKLFLSVDGYNVRTRGFIPAPFLVSPGVFVNGAQLATYLQTVGVPAASAAALATGIAKLPVGVVTPSQAFNRDALLLTYQQVGALTTRYGADLAAEYALTDVWRLMGNYSYLSTPTFGDVAPGTSYKAPLNAPRNKFMIGAGYRDAGRGLDADLRYRYVQGFDVASNIYVGHVDTYGILDLNGTYRLPRASGGRLILQGNNLLNNRTQQFVGAARPGRFVTLGVGYDFGGNSLSQ